MRRVLAGATMLVVAGMTAACGGASGAPEDASKDEFCKTWAEGNGVETQEALDDFVGKAEETGTPKGISKDAREGYEVVLEVLGDADVKDENALADLERNLPKDDRDKVTDFFAYYGETCAPASGG